MQILTHNITKRLIDTKTAELTNSCFINGASHKHSNYIFMIKSNYLFFFFDKSGVGFEIGVLSSESINFDYLMG